jgi:glutathione peroxidase
MRLLFLTLVLASSFAMTTMKLSADSVQSLYDLKVNSLDGKPVDLAQYKGHVVLVVNVASKCGFTPQYAGLEKLYLDYKDKGFVILGFPANDFGHQEPGTPEQIATFCTSKYSVTFPMFEKVVTKGEGQSPGLPIPDHRLSRTDVELLQIPCRQKWQSSPGISE